jgi:hypothetical protein
MNKREIWFAKIYSKEVKKNKTILHEFYTSIIGSNFNEVLTLPNRFETKIKGKIYKIDFLKNQGFTTYKL